MKNHVQKAGRICGVQHQAAFSHCILCGCPNGMGGARGGVLGVWVGSWRSHLNRWHYTAKLCQTFLFNLLCDLLTKIHNKNAAENVSIVEVSADSMSNIRITWSLGCWK